ncbi:unnamed protein product [Adineta ricciae]|uniref:Uncharacterized protein n=1 Tax=Adineta ricciae TaxID=249248 RepID=A0A815PPZ0_ADIRI|nr:unnamed protein product [Adineta ricciae]
MAAIVPTNMPVTNTLLPNGTTVFSTPCPTFFAPFYYDSPMGWNAVLVGLLSSILAIIFLLTCIYYLLCRRRYYSELPDSPTPVALVEKNGVTVTSSSQTATTTFINENGKETKISTYSEQGSNPTGNGHAGSSSTNGLLSNGNADPSELRLLSHEHH